MPHDRKFRFGVQVSSADSRKEWTDKARKVEDLGYSTLFIPDHFGGQLAPMPALLSAADATTTLRVGTLVLDNDYRHPVVLAKEAATVDVLSGGRLELGLGAGWLRTDYEVSGMLYDPPGTRVTRMEEGLAVIKGLFAEGPLTFEGHHYTIANLDGQPKPVQKPGPPILIGGGGRRVLSIAAREADIIGINPNLRAGEIGPEAAQDATADATARKVAWVRESAGARFDDLELSVLVFIVTVTEDRRSVAEGLAGAFGLSVEDALDVPLALVGTVNEICESLERRRADYGISYVVVQEGAMDDLAPVVAKLAGA